MISAIILIIWLFMILIPIFVTLEGIGVNLSRILWVLWALLSLLWIIPIFTGINVKNNEGQYKGYITAIEKNGTIFVGYNVYLKTDLTSSNEDTACIDRNNKDLIERLKKAQENKENITVEYEGVWQYKIGECPNSNWKIIKVLTH